MFAYLGFEQADQLAGEIKNPQQNLPRAIIIAVLIGTFIYILLQVVFIGAIPAQPDHGPRARRHPGDNPIAVGPFAGLAGVVGLGWLAIILRMDAFISPFGTGLIYDDLDLAGQLRPGQEPVLPADLRARSTGTASLVRPDHGVHGRPGLPAAVPELALAGRPGHLGERADVRGRAAVPGRVPQPGARTRTGRTGCPAPRCRAARVHRRQPDHLLVGLRDAVEARRRASWSATC